MKNKAILSLSVLIYIAVSFTLIKSSFGIIEEDMKKSSDYIDNVILNNEFNENNIEDETEIIYEEVIEDPIIFDGLTLNELADKLNRSLYNELANTGIYFAEYTKNTGLDPYLAVAIVLLETGCKWNCSYITINCNNIGGLKGHGSCNGSSYSRYDTLEEGIQSYLDIVYNGYYSQGLTTPELMNQYYAESPEWARKVNNYIEEIRAS